jgi:hypothetical protein
MKPLTKDALCLIVKSTARRAGLRDWKNVYPHCIRKASESYFRGRTSTGIPLDVKTQEFFMGHILPGSQDTYYDKTKIEELRKAYSTLIFGEEGEANELATLRTMVESGVLGISKPTVRSYLIQKLGIQDMKVKVAKVVELGYGEDEAHVRVICGKLGIEPMKIEASNQENSDPKKIVREDELKHYLVALF